MIRFFTRWVRSSAFCCLLVTAPGLAATPQPVIAIYYHGNIISRCGSGSDARAQRATAICDRDATEIVAVGNDATILRQKQPGTRLFDLKGAFVMPGINDAHVHMAYAGQNKLAVDLTGSTSLADMLRRVSAAARARATRDNALAGRRVGTMTLWTNVKTLPNPAGSRFRLPRSPRVFRPGGWAYCGCQFGSARSIGGDEPNPEPAGQPV